MPEFQPATLLDRHIRPALVEYLRLLDPSCAMFHEVPLARGVGRADLVAVNGHISGFEIKSERDSLARLYHQVIHYNLICEYSTIVTAKRHLSEARRIIPPHWGILVVEHGERVTFQSVRKPKTNRQLDKWALIRLMWKEECVDVLRRHTGETRPNLPVIRYWESLERLSIKVLTTEVREAFKRRNLRRFGQLQTQCDD